jgi:hypothetical protein
MKRKVGYTWRLREVMAGRRIFTATELVPALEEQRNGEWRYLEFLQVTSWITAGIFMREIPGGDESQASAPPG